jgi:hypothetical protein
VVTHGAGAGGTVTDPTHPTVTLGVTWLPPILAALHLALASCDNFKVRIAAAGALGAVPSRDAYRIPGGIPGAALPPPPTPLPTPDGPLAFLSAIPPVGHLSPALQRPGFDAYPTALAGLTSALASSDAAGEFPEYRYRDALQGAIRCALAHTVLAAERSDYGRMKTWFDAGAAGLLATWLTAEEGALMSAAGGVGVGGLVEAWPTPAAPPGPASPSRPGVDEEVPLRAASEPPPPFGVLAPHQGLDAAAVRGCWLRLAGLFRSRVRSLPNAEVARLYEERAKALGE